MGDDNRENERAHETVTLILKDERFEVEKKKLIVKSQYFAALLSPNYLERNRTEYVINYDISSTLLQDFIDWIHNDKIIFLFEMTSDESKLLDRLLTLLELSVLFAADNLIENITDKLEREFMSPKYVIHIWLIAQELNISILRDLSLACCLDRFIELPLESVCKLSQENFMKLVGNINLRYIKHNALHLVKQINFQLSKILIEWKRYNNDCTSEICIDSFFSSKNKEGKICHSIVSYKDKNSDQFIHCWDGNNFFQLTSFQYPTDITEQCLNTGKALEGVQVIGRRYDLYLCGGEYGIGSGRFNKNIWRYSLISKKWFLETVMPKERRHMITVFLNNNKLVLVYGVGKYRQKLQTIDIYDIYTGNFNYIVHILLICKIFKSKYRIIISKT
ncbi:hypothetical protein PUN28_018575 [Cardiocondyla obscurior]|uniref:BTB domain-containing protein n=1 Tax=Cardiocondyla obscurior TaxID=286306 RepID=A0AAW2EFI3_9HYME